MEAPTSTSLSRFFIANESPPGRIGSQPSVRWRNSSKYTSGPILHTEYLFELTYAKFHPQKRQIIVPSSSHSKTKLRYFALLVLLEAK